MIDCDLRDNGVPDANEMCTFTCNAGYELSGSNTRNCQGSSGSWSGSNAICNRGE